LLCTAGHEAVAAHLPGDDPNVGLHEYARPVIAAIAGRADVMHVAQSLGGFTAPLAAEAVQVSAMLRVWAVAAILASTGKPGSCAEAPGRPAQTVTSLTALRAA
jgi:hypothetical protein